MSLAGKKNLKPIRSVDEAREKGKKGGEASGEARRKKKTLRENMELLLGLDVTSTKDFNKLYALGIPEEEINNTMLLTAAMFERAKKGDVAAYKEIRDLVGESGKQPSTETNLLDAIVGAAEEDIDTDEIPELD